MTPEQRIKRHMILEAVALNDDLEWNEDITGENIEEAWEKVMVVTEAHWDYVSEFRQSGTSTGLPSQSSRHYECKEVARQLSDGGWVGWTYWYGGGKHGEPEAIDWMGEAYAVEVTEIMQPVKVFKKVDKCS